MKKGKLFLTATAVLLLIGPMACSVKQVVQAPLVPTLSSLNGQWVVLNDAGKMNEVMFDFRKEPGADLQLRVWGEKVKLKDFRKSETEDQFIFTYSLNKDKSYSVLATVIDHDKIKLSKIEDPIREFQPVGKLGEKVYHLKKRTQGDLKLVTKILNGGN